MQRDEICRYGFKPKKTGEIMKKVETLIVPVVLLLTVLQVSFVYSSTTGEIAGIVTDKKTGEKLPDAVISILETGRETKADENGYFHFLGVWAKTYNIHVCSAGHTPVTITNVIVHPEVTTFVNVQLTGESFSDKEIIKMAPAQIHNDKVSFWQEITAYEIEHLPASFLSVSHYENYQRYAVEQIIPNVFSVENPVEQTRIITKDGGGEYNGLFQYSTNKMGGTGFQNKLGHYYTTLADKRNNSMFTEKFYHPDRLQYLEFFVSGPEPISHYLFDKPNKLKFTFSGELFNTHGIFPNENDKVNYLSGGLLYQPNPNCRLSINGLQMWRKYSIYDHNWKNTTHESVEGYDLNNNGVIGDSFNMLEHLPKFERNESQVYINWLHSINSRMFYEINYGFDSYLYHYNINERINEDTDGDGHLDLYKDGIDADGDGDNRHEDLNGNGVWDWKVYGSDTDLFRDENNNGYIDASEHGPQSEWMPWEYLPFGRYRDTNDFYLYGQNQNISFHRMRWRNDRQSRHTLNSSFTWQMIDKMKWGNQIKVGMQGEYREIKNFDIDFVSGGNVYGSNFAVFPHLRSFYVQDKLNLRGGLLRYLRQGTLQLGLRYNYFDPNFKIQSEPTSPIPDSLHTVLPFNDVFKNAPSKKEWLSRLGFSFSITDRDVWYYNYQEYKNFWQPQYWFCDLSGFYPTIGYSSVDLEERYSHEWGLELLLSNFIKLEYSGFRKYFKDPVTTQVYYHTLANWYGVYIITNMGTYNGNKFSLKVYPTHFLAGRISYTYGKAMGETERKSNYEYVWAGDIVQSKKYCLDWDRRHTLSGYIHFRIPNNKSPEICKIKPLGGFYTTLSGSYLSGLPYSPPQRSRETEINTERLPSTFRLDLRIQKSFQLYGLDATLFCEVHNLLDRKNIFGFVGTDWYHTYKMIQEKYDNGEMNYEDYVSLMDVQDPNDIDGDGIFQEPDGEVDFNKQNPEMGSILDPTVYGPQRRVYFGVRVSW